MKKIYTSTGLRRYNRCPRYYYYEHELLLDKHAAPLFSTDSDALLLGRAIHAGFAEWYRHYPGYDYGGALSEYDDKIRKHAEVLLDGRAYTEKFGKIPKLEKIIAIESELSLKLGGTIIAGKLDAIAEYRDELWVVEHKSSRFGLKDELKYANALQSNLYIKMARAAGLNVKGILINYVRTISLREKANEGSDEFWERARQDVIDRSAGYFSFVELPRSEEEIRRVLHDVREEISHVEFDRSHGYFRRNPDACNEYQRLCEFHDVCEGRFREQEIVKREQEHPELSEEFLNALSRQSFEESFSCLF
jgi:hypothetical protein